MADYTVEKIYTSDKRTMKLVDELLNNEGIKRDKNLDYTCGVFNARDELVATGSCFKNTLRCLAVNHEYQGEGLMNLMISHLVDIEQERDNWHLFVYTKVSAFKFFKTLGFYEIARVQDQLVFLENRPSGFTDYLAQLDSDDHLKLKKSQKVASVVMNANPFSLGHQYLIEKAAAENDIVHLFMVSDDSSLIPFEDRKRLILAGTRHLNNVIYHESGSYIISSATFPSYFLKDSETVIKTQAQLDIDIFVEIANYLGITHRYVGSEPFSQVTSIYNDIMVRELQERGVTCMVVPRLKVDGAAVSASQIRLALKEDRLDDVQRWVPQTTLDFFKSAEGQRVIARLHRSTNVVHY